MYMTDDEERAEKRKNAYSSRLSRARAHNASERRGLTKAASSPSATTDSMANMAFSIPVQSEVDVAAQGFKNLAVSGTPSSKTPPKPVKELKSEASVFCKPDDENSIAAYWEWNVTQKLLAVVRRAAIYPAILSSRRLPISRRAKQNATSPPSHPNTTCAERRRSTRNFSR